MYTSGKFYFMVVSLTSLNILSLISFYPLSYPSRPPRAPRRRWPSRWGAPGPSEIASTVYNVDQVYIAYSY